MREENLDVMEFDFENEEDFSSADFDPGWYEVEVVKTELYEGKTSHKQMIKVTTKIPVLGTTTTNYIQLDNTTPAKRSRKNFLDAVSDNGSFGKYNDEKVFEKLCGITCFAKVVSEVRDDIAEPKIIKFAAVDPEEEYLVG